MENDTQHVNMAVKVFQCVSMATHKESKPAAEEWRDQSDG